MPSTLPQKILKKAIKERLCQRNDRLLIGVSGGADSVALFRILEEIKHSLNYTLSIVHFDHNLRRQSKKDALFVQNLAAKFHIPFYCERREVSKKSNQNLSEEYLRQARYAFFKKAMHQSQSTKLVLAHNQNDQAETVLLHLFKGSGLSGYGGIQTHRILDNIQIIRPLLEISREDILAYLSQYNQEFCQDPTNENLNYTRNFIRHKIIPVLQKEINPQLIPNLSQNANIIQKDYVYLESCALKKFKAIAITKPKSVMIDRKKLIQNPISLQRLIIRLAYQHLNGTMRSLTCAHMREVEELITERPVRSIVDLPHSINIIKKNDSLKFYLRKKA